MEAEGQSSDVLGAATRDDFDEEIRKLRASSTSGPLDRTFAGIGIGMAVVGFVTCLIAYTQATGFSDVRDQMESLILTAFGVSLVIFGSALYVRNSVTRFMRFWLLRVIYEQRDVARRDADAGARRALREDLVEPTSRQLG